jgi:glycogen(starch) synthase
VKVLMTADTVGGVWTYALTLADALAPHGVEVTLVATGGRLSPAQRMELRGSAVARAFAKPYPLEWMPDPWHDLRRNGEWLLRIADEIEPDLVHLNAYAHAVLPFDAPVLVAGHSCVLSWHEAVRGRAAGPEWARYREVVRDGLAAADVVIAPTQAMLDALVRHYDPPSARRVVPNGAVATGEAQPKEPLVAAAGRMWDEAKNLDALARVAPRLEWPVVVAGAGGGRRPDGVAMLGQLGRDGVRDLLARASIFAAPARYEPFGLAPLEAALAGCALVLGDIPSLREVWGDAATFVAPDDDEALAAALSQLVADDALRAVMAERAEARAQEYTPERMAAGTLAAYAQVLDREAVA